MVIEHFGLVEHSIVAISFCIPLQISARNSIPDEIECSAIFIQIMWLQRVLPQHQLYWAKLFGGYGKEKQKHVEKKESVSLKGAEFNCLTIILTLLKWVSKILLLVVQTNHVEFITLFLINGRQSGIRVQTQDHFFEDSKILSYYLLGRQNLII